MPNSIRRNRRDGAPIIWFLLFSLFLNVAAAVAGFWIHLPNNTTPIMLTEADMNDAPPLGSPDAPEEQPPDAQPTPPPEPEPTPPPLDKPPEFELPEATPTPAPPAQPQPTAKPKTEKPKASPNPNAAATPGQQNRRCRRASKADRGHRSLSPPRNAPGPGDGRRTRRRRRTD